MMPQAVRPELQKLFTVVAEPASSHPAYSAAVWAMLPPWSPVWVTQPSTISWTAAGDRPVRTARASNSCLRMSTGRRLFRPPPSRPLPRGARTASIR